MSTVKLDFHNRDAIPRVGEELVVAMAKSGETHCVAKVVHGVGLDHFISIKALLNG